MKKEFVKCIDCENCRNDSDDGEMCNISCEPIPDLGFGVQCEYYIYKLGGE